MATFAEKNNKKKESRLMKKAEINEKNAAIDTSPGLFENYRDGYRAMTNIVLGAVVVAFFMNILAFGFYILKDKPQSFITTTNGTVVEVKPYKVD
jgi:hypothetical protein